MQTRAAAKNSIPRFPPDGVGRVTQLKQKLQQDTNVYPGLGEIHLSSSTKRSKGVELSLFPHLFLPDLVEAHVAKLDLNPRRQTGRDRVPRRFLDRPSYHQLSLM